MYKIIVDGEIVEIVMCTEEDYSIEKYVKDNYLDKGYDAKYRELII